MIIFRAGGGAGEEGAGEMNFGRNVCFKGGGFFFQ